MWLASDRVGEKIVPRLLLLSPQTDHIGTLGQHSAASMNESGFCLAVGT